MIALNENGGAAKPALKTELEPAAKKFAESHTLLTELVGRVNEEIESIKRRALPAIKKAVGVAAERHAELKALIEQNPGLFDKPRTVVLHGIKLGLQKGKGGNEFDDAEAVVERIFKQMGDMGEDFVHVSYKPNKEALLTLDVGTLKKFGCTVRNTGDEVVIKPVDGDVDKIVRALLKDATEEAKA